MRSDFLEIVRDLRCRSASATASSSSNVKKDLNVKISGDLSELYIGEEIFGMGDMVLVFSVLSQENISGIITALSHKEIVIRTGTGARFSVLVGQIRTGRVSLSKDREMMENATVFKAAAEMDHVMNSFRNYAGVQY